jgi:predicted homoserine dehydrogenase-like protein
MGKTFMQLAAYDIGYHMFMRDLQADVVLGDIVSYVADKNGVLPSGQEVVED